MDTLVRYLWAIVFCMVFLVVCTGYGRAVSLVPWEEAYLPGTTLASSPHLAGQVVVEESMPFSFAAYGGEVMGDVLMRVVRSSMDNTLDFYWQLSNNASSAGSLGAFRLAMFIAPAYNADYLDDSTGDIGPDKAFLLDDYFVGFVDFYFSQGLMPGMASKMFFLDTTAYSCAKSALFDLTSEDFSEVSGLYETYAPSPIPVPAGVFLLAPALGCLGMMRLGRRTKAS